jgi:hypothetical protein
VESPVGAAETPMVVPFATPPSLENWIGPQYAESHTVEFSKNPVGPVGTSLNVVGFSGEI